MKKKRKKNWGNENTKLQDWTHCVSNSGNRKRNTVKLYENEKKVK